MSVNKLRNQSPNSSPRVIVVGCGAFAENFYLPAIAKFPSVREKVILVDTNTVRAQNLAAKFNIKSYTNDYKEYLWKVDGAIVATPNQFHFPVCSDFIKAGVHILSEKPLTESLAETNDLVDQADKHGVALAVNQTRRLFPSYSEVKKMIASNVIGEILSLQYYEGWKFSWPTVSGFYFNTKVNPKGILMDIGVHVLDAICMWLGEKPELVSSETDSFGGAESVAYVKFKHKDCIGEVKLSRLSKLQNSFRITGEKGVVEGGTDDWKSLTLISKTGQKNRLKFPTSEKSYGDFANPLVENFLDVIESGAKPLVSAEEVVSSISWIEECYQSAVRFNMPWYNNLEVPNVC